MGNMEKGWQKRVMDEKEKHKAQMEEKHGVVGHPKANLLYKLAWREGHGNGFSEVGYYYEELVGLIKDAETKSHKPGPKDYDQPVTLDMGCGCSITGDGTLPSPIRIKQCAKHKATDDTLLALEGCRDKLVSCGFEHCIAETKATAIIDKAKLKA